MGPLKTGMSTLFIGLECVTDRQPVVIVIIRKKNRQLWQLTHGAPMETAPERQNTDIGTAWCLCKKKKQKILNALLLMLTWLLHALSSSSSPIALPPLLFF